MTVSDPSQLTPTEAIERHLDRKSASVAPKTIRFYRNRLSRFAEFCERADVETVGDLTPWLVDQYLDELGAAAGREEIAPTTHKGHVVALNQLVDYLVGVRAVDEDLTRPIDVPTVETQDEASDKHLATDAARQLLGAFRESMAYYGQPRHVMLEVAWHVGARVGGYRALDRDDADLEERVLSFRHRPSTDTRLKNGADGERDVAIPPAVADALEIYVERERPRVRDDHGRDPLFATSQGRASISTLRTWTYYATQPCVAVSCPHGETRERCTFRERDQVSKCPSSRAPHHVRSGSITWQLNEGVPLEVVAERVNASPAIIAKHYDVAGARERLEQRRRPYVDGLDIAGSEGSRENIATSDSPDSESLTAIREKAEGWYGDGGI